MNQIKYDEFISEAINFVYSSEEKQRKAMDIVSVMLSIFHGDITTKGNHEFHKPRSIKLKIGVYNLKEWQSIRLNVEELANWVSGDKFQIEFIHICREIKNSELLFNPELSTDFVTLFSGGLDSFSGAFYNYQYSLSSDYVGYVNKNEEKTAQDKMGTFYKLKFPNEGYILKKKYAVKKLFLFQSTRSLLYLSLAVSRALAINSTEVRMYENGILSLNPDIGERFTTKTTHPKTIFMYNQILSDLNYSIKIVNAFEYTTKGANIDAMDEAFKEKIRYTYTCGRGRSPGQKEVHKGQCGVCIPCILRKISMAAYDNEVHDTDYYVNYDINSFNGGQTFITEYKNNLGYFAEYVNLINSGEIFGNILQNRKKYHSDENYLELQRKMFSQFASEYERYLEKYDLH